MTWLKKNKIRSLAVICSAVVLAVIGSTMAYFTSTDEVSNRFSVEMERVDIMLTEPSWNPENGELVVPGDVLPKDPQITNREKSPAFVFLRVTVPCDSPEIEYDTDGEEGKNKGDIRSGQTAESNVFPMYKFGVKYGDTEEYIYDETDGTDQEVRDYWWTLVKSYGTGSSFVYVYAYTENGSLKVLNTDETTPDLFDAVKICNFNENFTGESHNIKVEAFGIQTLYLGTDDLTPEYVWGLINEEG